MRKNRALLRFLILCSVAILLIGLTSYDRVPGWVFALDLVLAAGVFTASMLLLPLLEENEILSDKLESAEKFIKRLEEDDPLDAQLVAAMFESLQLGEPVALLRKPDGSYEQVHDFVTGPDDDMPSAHEITCKECKESIYGHGSFFMLPDGSYLHDACEDAHEDRIARNVVRYHKINPHDLSQPMEAGDEDPEEMLMGNCARCGDSLDYRTNGQPYYGKVLAATDGKLVHKECLQNYEDHGAIADPWTQPHPEDELAERQGDIEDNHNYNR